MKSELFEAEKSLLTDKKLASKLTGSCATQASEWEEHQKLQAKKSAQARHWESTETAVARRGTEKTLATLTAQEQVQEALQQLQARGEGEINSGGTCAQSKREEGARIQGGAVLSSFATTETNEQLKPGNGTQEPKKKIARGRDPRTREQTARDRDPRTRGEEKEGQGESVDNRQKQVECADENGAVYVEFVSLARCCGAAARPEMKRMDQVHGRERA